MVEKLSVFLIAKNQQNNIKACLETVKWADEIVVVIDSLTTDRTAAIAGEYTKKIYFNGFINFGQQYDFALQKTTGDWLLKLDPDERVTLSLKKEIQRKVKSKEFSGYLAYFRPVFLGEKFMKADCRVHGNIRLFRKTKAKMAKSRVHEKVTVSGKTGVLENEILHLSFPSISETLNKFNQYTDFEAEELYVHGGRTNLLYMFLAPVNIFLKRYLLEKHFLEGIYGFVYSLLFGYYYFVKHAKLWEMQAGKRKINI